MKAAGVNAIRTSHNPPSPELLEFADRLGLLVMDEAFDMWRIPKVPNGYSKYFDAWSERDLRDMVRRDRNHPSVIMWSIGNEIPEQRRCGRLEGGAAPHRTVSRGGSHAPDDFGVQQLGGRHSQQARRRGGYSGFQLQARTLPGDSRLSTRNWVIYGSETASCVSSRGTYHLPLEKYDKHPSLQISSYDIIAPPVGLLPGCRIRRAGRATRHVLGEFVWTGFDYLGEPTPYFDSRDDHSNDWPARSSYFGMVDLAGFPKDRYYLYQSVWTTTPMVHLLPHWNWPGLEGQSIPVMVYSNADEVELSLNGRSLGRKRPLTEPVELPVGPNVSASLKFASKYRLLWQVPYEPGLLQAVAFRQGVEVARDTMSTAGAPARIRLLADRTTVAAGGDDLSFVTVRIEDQAGHLCPTADNLVRFRVTGAGEIAAVDNGNAATVEPFHADHRKAFNGLALLIVRPLTARPCFRLSRWPRRRSS